MLIMSKSIHILHFSFPVAINYDLKHSRSALNKSNT